MDVEKSLEDRISERKQTSRPANRDRASRPARAPAATPYNRPPPKSTEDAWTHDMYSNRGVPKFAGAAGPGGFRPRAAEGRETRLMVSNIHYEVSKDDLKSIFSRAGTITDGPTIRLDELFECEGRMEMSLEDEMLAYPTYNPLVVCWTLVTYETNKQAKDAINKFDGNLAKGQALSIKFDDYQPRPVESMSKGASDLLGRIEGGSKMRSDTSKSSNGPIGNSGSEAWGRGPTRAPDARPAASTSRNSRSERGPRPARSEKPASRNRKPATAEDLDKELETYHAPAAPISLAPVVTDGDVEMS